MYNIKVYERDSTTLKDTIQIEKLENISNFSSQVNWWFWTLNIWLAYSITDTSIEIWDIVKVQYKNDVIYNWSVLNNKKIYSSDQEIIQLNLIWYASLLTTLMTNSTYSDTASNIAKDLIDDFNVEYWHSLLSYDTSSIPSTVWTLDLDFSSYKTYFQALEAVAETAWLYFFVDLDWKVYLDEKANFTSHTLRIWEDVDTINIDEDWKELVNSLTLKYNWGTKTYSDATSQTTYWKREKYLDKSSELSNVTTADEYWANYISIYKDKVKKVSIIVNNEYNFFDIKWGDLINVRNLWYIINYLQVAKITYWLEKATIELEKSYSFAKEIFIW